MEGRAREEDEGGKLKTDMKARRMREEWKSICDPLPHVETKVRTKHSLSLYGS